MQLQIIYSVGVMIKNNDEHRSQIKRNSVWNYFEIFAKIYNKTSDSNDTTVSIQLQVHDIYAKISELNPRRVNEGKAIFSTLIKCMIRLNAV